MFKLNETPMLKIYYEYDIRWHVEKWITSKH